MDTLRFGVIGVGGRGIHNAKAVAAREDVELVGVCDTDPARLVVCGAEGLPGERLEDYRQLLDRDLHAVCINTDNDVHAEITLASAARGYHVYCEKPIALNVPDAEGMVAACEGLATVVNLSLRLAPTMRYMRELVHGGEWGKLLAVGAAHPKPGGLLCQGKGHRATNDHEVWGPILMHDGVHISEWLRFMGGEVVSAYAQTRSTGPDPGNEELIAAVTAHENGVMGSLSYMAMPFMDGRQYAICEQASVWPGSGESGPCLHVARVDSGVQIEELAVPKPELTGDAAAVDEFIRAIREGHQPYATMEDGLAGQRIVDAIRRSGLEGTVILL